MGNAKLVHIVPNLPPAICGVGDYALAVSKAMNIREPGINSSCIAAGIETFGKQTPGTSRFWNKVEDALGDDTLLAAVIHYSGYGYASNGAPGWLPIALLDRPEKFRNTKILAFFHELYAPLWPLRKSFYTTGIQKRVARRVLHACDFAFTNRKASATWLEQQAKGSQGKIPFLPVPSNVGQLASPISYESRAPHAIIFGNQKAKRPFLAGRGAQQVATVCQRLAIKTIFEIGRPCPNATLKAHLKGIDFQQTGFLPDAEVSSLLRNARIGFFDYFPGYLSKSGVLAALASHGVVPIGFPRIQQELHTMLGLNDEPITDLKTLGKIDCEVGHQLLSRCSSAIWKWSQGHDVDSHAKLLLEGVRITTK